MFDHKKRTKAKEIQTFKPLTNKPFACMHNNPKYSKQTQLYWKHVNCFAWHLKVFKISVQLKQKGECRECVCFALTNYKLIINEKKS
jgi:hypothetical protein